MTRLFAADPPKPGVAPPGVPSPAGPPIALVIAAFLSLYFFWGSTYLGIKLAIEPPLGFPAFFMAGVRNLLAGVILYVLVRARSGFDRATRPTRRYWGNAAVVGTLLLLGGNGLVSFSTQFLPSSIVALLIAMLPIWMAMLERVWERPTAATPVQRRPLAAWLGIALGFAGVVMLMWPKVAKAIADRADTTHASDVWPAVGAGMVLLSSFCWANGSLLSRRANRAGGLPPWPFLSTAMQLVCGGIALLVVSGAASEFPRVQLASFTAIKPVLAVAYLTVAGSLIGFTAYIWLLSVTTPSRVATYAYVNPIVAVWLGWWLGNETLDARTLLAAAVIIAGVVLIVTFNRPSRPAPPAPALEKALDEEEELCGSATQR